MKRRTRWWLAASLIAGFTISVAAYWKWLTAQGLQPWQFLAHVVQLEQGTLDPPALQSLGWSLTILGRDDEVRELDFFPQFSRPASRVDVSQLELHAVPWRQAVETVAGEHRLVMIMEDHCVSKHRAFIEATLPVFRQAQFTHYAAEAISQGDPSLAQRRFPASRTGLYTADPRFGNLLRRAFALNFEVTGYDFQFTTHEAREEGAATRLAALLAAGPSTRLVVHAGHAHVLKETTKLGERWLAARLWEKTGIEPFTIWQWSSGHDARDYSEIVRVLQDRGVMLDEPVVLMPPPPISSGLRDAPYELGSVDAIVIHPPDRSVAPASRVPLFPRDMQRLSGVWNGDHWPVVVCAYQKGEPADAIPLDQIMLREPERDFILWIPSGAAFEIRTYDERGTVLPKVDVRESKSLQPRE